MAGRKAVIRDWRVERFWEVRFLDVGFWWGLGWLGRGLRGGD